MVFEQLYSAEFLHDHPAYGFLLGIAYTILALFIALIIFPDDPALIAVGLIALLLIPSLSKLTETSEAAGVVSPGFKDFLKTTLPQTKVYVTIFFGIFFTFAFFSIILPHIAASHLFSTQLNIVKGNAATFNTDLWTSLFTWNLQVLGLSFLLSLIAGNGAIFFIAWNASVWGTIFGNLASSAASATTANPFILFLLVIISVFPHTFAEGLSYMIAAISGTTLSAGLTREQLISPNMWKVFKYNALLLFIGIGVLAVAMLIETYVLGNFTTYRTIINLAFPR
ncbi:MAG TPA: stage II sporulation protein M [Candidatus Nanoarchaeia archaeon]|nr:stage II sporulation protein M [Candidatus Nanoarchaeia archaeon]